MDDAPVNLLVAAAAFPIGIIFGVMVRWGDFCTMGAISDIGLMGDWRRFRAWMLALAVAIAASQFLHIGEFINLDNSIYLSPRLGWAGAIAGGGMFGFGMMLAGGCGSRNAVRLGGGNLKSLLVVLVLGLVAYATLRGILALPRLRLDDATAIDLSGLAHDQSLATLAAGAGLGEATMLRPLIAAGLVVSLVVFAFTSPRFLRSPRHWLSAIVIGLAIPLGWIVTGILGADSFDPAPLASLTFVAPVGEGLIYLMTYTGATVSFGIAAVAGTVFGGFLASLAQGQFRLETFADGNDFLRHLVGAALMGAGGVLAMGCTIGQGLTGLSTLAVGSLIAVLAIIGGSILGLRYLQAHL